MKVKRVITQELGPAATALASTYTNKYTRTQKRKKKTRRKRKGR